MQEIILAFLVVVVCAVLATALGWVLRKFFGVDC
jgi:hypothetical protein